MAKEQAIPALTRDVRDLRDGAGGGWGSYVGLVSAIALASVFWTVVAGVVCRFLDAPVSLVTFAVAASLVFVSLTVMAAPIFLRAES